MANLGGGSAESQIYDASELILAIIDSGEQEGAADAEQIARLREAILANKTIIMSMPGVTSSVVLLCEDYGETIDVELVGRISLEINSKYNTFSNAEPYIINKVHNVEERNAVSSDNIISNGHYYDYGLVNGLFYFYSQPPLWENYEARIEFQTGDVPPRVYEYKKRIKWANDVKLLEDGTPEIKPNKRYLIEIVRDLGRLYEFEK